MLRGLAVAGVALGLSCLTAGAALAVTRVPNPPKQLCIGTKCATTPAAPVVGGKVKWNPGHYGASGGIAFPGDSLAKFRPEMDDMLKDDWIVGYRLFITWAAMDAGPVSFTSSVGGATGGTLTTAPGNGTYWVAFSNGEYRAVTVNGTASTWTAALQPGAVTDGHLYTTNLLDSVLSRLKTAYNKPKQLVIAVLPMSFSGGSRSPQDFSRVPRYIATDSKYGPSPDGTSYGWWGPPPGQTKGLYTTAVYRPAVAEQYAHLGQALGAKYNSDPNFEAIMDMEDSGVTEGAQNYPPKDPTYTGAGYAAAMQMYFTAWRSTFPNTNIIDANTWLFDPTGTQQFGAWMITGGQYIAPGAADTVGQSYYDAGNAAASWGQAAYFGITAGGSQYSGPDFRPIARAMMDVEGGDIGSGSGGGLNNTPLDIVNALNKTVKASHAFWCHVPAGNNPPKWAQVTAVLGQNPLTNTGYPQNYPQ